MERKINGVSVEKCVAFAYDGCHKIYVLRRRKDIDEFKKLGYQLFKLEGGIIQCYVDSCSLRFIDLYDGSKGTGNDCYTQLVPQFCKKVVFEGFDTDSIDANGIDYYHLKAHVENGNYVVEAVEEEVEVEA